VTYSNFIDRKLTSVAPAGIEVPDAWRGAGLFDFQSDLTRWAIRRGRAAIFADTGLGKSRMQLRWAYTIHASTGVDVLILAPLALPGRRERAAPARRLWLGTAGYFAAIGVAFMFVEIAFIQKFILFLGHPLYAIAVVLFAFLLSAGLGSRCSERLRFPAPARVVAVAWPVLAIAAIALAYTLLLPRLLPPLAAWPDAARIALAVALIFPLGFAMGMPFPLGMARLAAAAEALVPWAWGLNACASVVSAVLATLLAIHLGFSAVLLLAVLLYALAVASAAQT